MEEKKTPQIPTPVIYIVLIISIIYGYLALLNGRYNTAKGIAFDKWTEQFIIMSTSGEGKNVKNL